MLNELAEQIYKANKQKGFWDKERNVGEMLMLITSELGEAMDAHRKCTFSAMEAYQACKESSDIKEEDKQYYLETCFKSLVKDTFEDEIADAIIRILDLCGGMKIDIDAHIKEKLAFNETRPMLHGKSY